MRLLETAKFARSRKKLIDIDEKKALLSAIRTIAGKPLAGKKLHGGLAHLRSFRYSVRGQVRLLIYKVGDTEIVLFSFGPRQSIYKDPL